MPSDRCDLLCIDLDRAEALRKNRLDVADASRAAARARVLADPTRLTLVSALREADELCVCDLAWIAERSQNLVSHHLRALRVAGLVRSRRDGKMVIYSLTDEGARLLDAVLVEGVREGSLATLIVKEKTCKIGPFPRALHYGRPLVDP